MSNLKLHDEIRKVMAKKKSWKSHEIQSRIAKKSKLYSESTITSRLREMPDVISKRPTKKGVSSWDYQLIK